MIFIVSRNCLEREDIVVRLQTAPSAGGGSSFGGQGFALHHHAPLSMPSFVSTYETRPRMSSFSVLVNTLLFISSKFFRVSYLKLCSSDVKSRKRWSMLSNRLSTCSNRLSTCSNRLSTCENCFATSSKPFLTIIARFSISFFISVSIGVN